MDLFYRYKKNIIFFLLLAIFLPFFLLISSSVVYGADLDWIEDKPWLKGLLLFVLSFIINRFVGNINSDEQVNTNQIYEGEVITIENNLNSDKEVLGFYVNWLTPGANSYDSLKENWQSIDMVAPFWYTLQTDGEIRTRYGGYQYEVDSFARNRNIQVLPLINNSQENTLMLTDPEIRAKAVYNIVDLVQKYNFAGVNIDFELLPSWTRNSYTAFIKQLSTELKKINKLTTISVFPKIDVPLELQGAYDYAALAPLVDRIVIMTYDKHWSTGPAGPIAPINWVEENIQYALEYIPAEKIILGVANYGYDWTGGYGQDLSSKEALNLANKKGAEIKWHDIYQTPYFYYWENERKHEVWFENSNSLAFKLDLVNKYNLKGIGIWRLGNENTDFWETINNKFDNNR
ncbi:MAG: glycosyl hydrolase family 18 protein [Halanaerobiales bacterium]|nr:glycosyl hydrolase family 18 protein [Bacillota bacterium]HOA40009.1 glycosyl hydrolase family 18 protein [Halanaerobiales bacterium]HPZ62085.1 glycosyl hydrolase family 18 protein [Halanaerobiales bacterium]HQD03418.1 glycosyl hydrolase family 18 protein [Halanaerobiales bacterium]